MRTFVKVKPNSKTSQILEASDGSLIVQLRSAPVDGKANAELIQLLAKKYEVPRSHITIVSGQNSRSKWIEITPS